MPHKRPRSTGAHNQEPSTQNVDIVASVKTLRGGVFSLPFELLAGGENKFKPDRSVGEKEQIYLFLYNFCLFVGFFLYFCL